MNLQEVNLSESHRYSCIWKFHIHIKDTHSFAVWDSSEVTVRESWEARLSRRIAMPSATFGVSWSRKVLAPSELSISVLQVNGNL